MSTRSKRREERRAKLQAAWERKVEGVVRSRELARRPERVRADEFVERIEEHPFFAGDPTERPRRIVWLKRLFGDDVERPPVRFVVPYCPRRSAASLLWAEGIPSFDEDVTRLASFTWRAYRMRAGDTEIRWFVPEVTGVGMSEEMGRAEHAARAAAAHVRRLVGEAESSAWTPFHLNAFRDELRLAAGALAEWLGDDDPKETRAERERATGGL